MNIEVVTYFKTFPIGSCWEKIGVSVKVNEGESLTDILNQAKKEVEDWHIKSNPQIYTGGVRTIPDGETLPVIKESPIPNEEDDKEWELFRGVLEAFTYREDAQEYLEMSSFKLTINAKAIVNSKPLKNEQK